MKVSVPRIGQLVLYVGHNGDVFGDRHRPRDPVVALVIKSDSAGATLRLFPDSGDVPLRRDVDCLPQAPDASNSGIYNVCYPFPGTEAAWTEIEVAEPVSRPGQQVEFEGVHDENESAIRDWPKGEPPAPLASPTARPAVVIQKPPASQTQPGNVGAEDVLRNLGSGSV